METFNFSAPAEIYATRGRGSSRRPISYYRFDTAALAVQYAIETLPSEMLIGTVMEAGEARIDAAGIRKLYESSHYPLARRVAPEPVKVPRSN